MNGIDKIIEKITADARQEAEAILSQARSEAAAITAGYAEKARQEAEKIMLPAKEQAGEIQRRAKSAAHLRARQQVLAAKQDLISQAFDNALDRLLHLPAAEYTALLASLAAQAAKGDEAVILSAGDREALGPAVVEQANKLLGAQGKKAALVLSEKTRALKGGLLLEAGSVEVNCSLETILQLSREELALDVAAALFA